MLEIVYCVNSNFLLCKKSFPLNRWLIFQLRKSDFPFVRPADRALDSSSEPRDCGTDCSGNNLWSKAGFMGLINVIINTFSSFFSGLTVSQSFHRQYHGFNFVVFVSFPHFARAAAYWYHRAKIQNWKLRSGNRKNHTTWPHLRATAQPPKKTTTQPQHPIIIIIIAWDISEQLNNGFFPPNGWLIDCGVNKLCVICVWLGYPAQCWPRWRFGVSLGKNQNTPSKLRLQLSIWPLIPSKSGV